MPTAPRGCRYGSGGTASATDVSELAKVRRYGSRGTSQRCCGSSARHCASEVTRTTPETTAEPYTTPRHARKYATPARKARCRTSIVFSPARTRSSHGRRKTKILSPSWGGRNIIADFVSPAARNERNSQTWLPHLFRPVELNNKQPYAFFLLALSRWLARRVPLNIQLSSLSPPESHVEAADEGTEEFVQ